MPYYYNYKRFASIPNITKSHSIMLFISHSPKRHPNRNVITLKELRKAHVCFFTHTVTVDLNKEEAKIARSRFLQDIKESPSRPHQLVDYIDGREYYYENGITHCTPFLIHDNPIDLRCLMEAAIQLAIENKKYRYKYFRSFIWTLLEGKELSEKDSIHMSESELLEYTKDLGRYERARSNKSDKNHSSLLAEYKQKGPIEKWCIRDKNGNRNAVKIIIAQEYAYLLVNRYKTMYAKLTDPKGILFDDLKTFLSH